MNGSSNLSFAERLESLKAGGVGAVATGCTFSVTLLANTLISPLLFPTAIAQPGVVPDLKLFVSTATVLLAGFLFGMTYRYIVREDHNPHLKSGAVLAFGLVRGSAQLDVGLTLQANLWPWGLLAVESILLFAVARFTLDWLLKEGWLKPLSSQ